MRVLRVSRFNAILDECYKKALSEIQKDNGKSVLESLPQEQRNRIEKIMTNASTQKAVVAVLITSLTKKIETPSQDVRLHQDKMEDGYSGRTLDTSVITPFMHRNFRKFSMRESGWLTRSLEQALPYDLKYPGEIRNKNVKDAFLMILDDIEKTRADPFNYLVSAFIILENEKRKINKLASSIPKVPSIVPIGLIIDSLKEHFFFRYDSYGASKLPVIAIYSIYEIMVTELARFESKKLLELKSHTTSDIKAKSVGDVEVIDKDGEFFEAVEIKLGIPISYDLVKSIYEEKIKKTKLTRYYVLTSAQPFIAPLEEDSLKKLVAQIKGEHGCEVILNGLIPSIKYYLRLIKSTKDFLEIYNTNLAKDIQTSSEIKKAHFEKWLELLKNLGIV